MSTPTVRWNRYGGVAIAVLGFVITRQFVAETVQTESTAAFLLVSLPPLVVGLGMTVYGVVLAVGQFSSVYLRTVTLWCGLGTLVAAGLVAVTQLTMSYGSAVDLLASSQPLVANIVLSGAVAGIVVGDRSAANTRKRREIQRTANRAALVNRRLRHDVLNAAAIIDGHADLLAADPGRTNSVRAITTAAARITDTIEEVGQIATPNEDAELSTVQLDPQLSAAADDCLDAYPDCSVTVESIPPELTVTADERLRLVFEELLVNAVKYSGEGPISIQVETTPQSVGISIVDGGEGLDDQQRALLEAGRFPEYDDPNAGFGLQVVRLLVDRYGGRITTTEGADDSHRVTVWLPRYAQSGSVVERTGLRVPTIGRAMTAGLIAGVAMGGLYQATTGTMPVIGALYGVSHIGIGWLTHLFHSVIFALVFATGCRLFDIEQYISSLPQAAAVGVGWGAVLWFVAAGFVMPTWLLAIGQPATLPTLEPIGLAAHTLWGLTLGGSYLLLGRSGRFERVVGRL